jgi:phosphocarrier protein
MFFMSNTTAQQYTLLAPTSALVVPITEVPDPVFAQNMLGLGVAFNPLGNELCAPITGKIIQCAPTAHAVTIEAAEGVELLMHFGIDTVMLKGDGITMLVKEGDWVEAGTPLIRFDRSQIEARVPSLITPIIAIGSTPLHIAYLASGSLAQGEVLAILSTEAASLSPEIQAKALPTSSDETYSIQALLALENGLHARPATKLKKMASDAQVTASLINTSGQEADVQRLTALLNLGLAAGDTVTVKVCGPNSQTVAEAMQLLLETPEGVANHSSGTDTPPLLANDITAGLFRGVTASHGLALGALRPFIFSLPTYPEEGVSIAHETSLFTEKLTQFKTQLNYAMHAAAKDTDKAAILDAHLALLDDDSLSDDCLKYIQQGKSAAFAWKTCLEERIAVFHQSNSQVIRERAADLRDLQLQLLQLLLGIPTAHKGIDPSLAGAIVVADDLTPSQMMALAHIKPAGICLAKGGATSHVSVLCRGAAIPCLVGMGPSILTLSFDLNASALLNASEGLLEANPSADRLAAIKVLMNETLKANETANQNAQLPAISLDKVHIHVAANITHGEEAQRAFSMGADAIGLFRSEFLFLDRQDSPSIEEQRLEYQAAVDGMQGKPVIIRMLDIGADKQLPWLDLGHCPNPALGIRGTRLIELHSQLITDQLEALLSVKAPLLPNGQSALQIMLPMVSDVNDVLAIRKHIELSINRLNLRQRPDFVTPQIGVMIEVPSAALMAGQLARVADFFSIGTNDLTQYTLAMDREEPKLGAKLDVLHPAVLQLIHLTCLAAQETGIPVGVCGASAGDDIAALVLAALGVTELSVETQRLASIKAKLRAANLAAIREETLTSMAFMRDGSHMRAAMRRYLGV